ncbi:MAG: ATPase [Paludibacteraceae bacterium]|nr:ATPase [Paludibacteraceae bacterium]
MILLADSGSTKTHWCLMTANGQSSEFFTDGINPFLQTTDAMRNTIQLQFLPQIAHLLWAGTITHIFFYGAGCTPEKKKFVAAALQACFKKSEVCVESDMIGAVHGLLGSEAGIACILGTGANSCYYDGKQVVKNVPALGYILGDEGSGAVLGKRLVADVLKNQLGDDLKEQFLSRFNVTQADIVEHVYRQPFPNRYLANFSRFCADNISDPRIYKLVYNHFDYFAKRILPQYPKSPVGFVGSIAYYYQDILKKVLCDNGFETGKILQSPMEGMKEFHKKDIVPTT